MGGGIRPMSGRWGIQTAPIADIQLISVARGPGANIDISRGQYFGSEEPPRLAI